MPEFIFGRRTDSGQFSRGYHHHRRRRHRRRRRRRGALNGNRMRPEWRQEGSKLSGDGDGERGVGK